MTKKWLVAPIAAAALAVSTGAFAQQRPEQAWYIGAELGQSDFGSEKDTAYKFLGGFQVNRYFGVEAGYGWLYDKNSSEVKALEALAVGTYPIGNQFSLFGKFGLASMDVKTPGGSDDSTELTFGVGVQYDATRQLGIRAGWQRYDTDQEVDVISIGVVYRF